MTIQSPCVDICKLDNTGICIGCFRTLGEIAQWSRMTDAEKKLACAELNNRRKISGQKINHG